MDHVGREEDKGDEDKDVYLSKLSSRGTEYTNIKKTQLHIVDMVFLNLFSSNALNVLTMHFDYFSQSSARTGSFYGYIDFALIYINFSFISMA